MKNTNKLWMTCLIVFFGTLTVLANSSTDKQSPTTGEDGFSYAPVVENIMLGMTFIELKNKTQGMTDLQFSNYEKTIVDQCVKWKGTVAQVSENIWSDGISVRLKFLEESFTYDGSIDVPNETAIKLNKGQKLTVTACIKSLSNIMGFTVNFYPIK